MEEIKYDNAFEKEWRVFPEELTPPIRARVRLDNDSLLEALGHTKEEARNNLLKAIEKYART
jgi:hypothetical protein